MTRRLARFGFVACLIVLGLAHAHLPTWHSATEPVMITVPAASPQPRAPPLVLRFTRVTPLKQRSTRFIVYCRRPTPERSPARPRDAAALTALSSGGFTMTTCPLEARQ